MSRVTAPAARRDGYADALESGGQLGRKIEAMRQEAAGGDAAGEVDGFKHRLTSAAATGAHKPPGVAASVWEDGKMARPRRKPARPIDLDKVVFETDVPLPERRRLPRDTVAQSCRAVLQRMAPLQSVVLDQAQGLALVRLARREGIRVKRELLDGDRVRVWRMPPSDAGKKGAAAGGDTDTAVWAPRAFAQGWRAGRDDRPIDANPYSPERDEHAQWAAGWQACADGALSPDVPDEVAA